MKKTKSYKFKEVDLVSLRELALKVKCNALFIYLIILLENIVYYYILYDFLAILWRVNDVWRDDYFIV